MSTPGSGGSWQIGFVATPQFAPALSKEQDARLRLIRELEAIAYVDPGDIMQWDRPPVFDNDGNLTGYRDRAFR